MTPHERLLATFRAECGPAVARLPLPWLWGVFTSWAERRSHSDPAFARLVAAATHGEAEVMTERGFRLAWWPAPRLIESWHRKVPQGTPAPAQDRSLLFRLN